MCVTPEQCLYPVNIAAFDIAARNRSINVFKKTIETAAELEAAKTNAEALAKALEAAKAAVDTSAAGALDIADKEMD